MERTSKEVSSFLEVPANFDVRVNIDGKVFDLGFVSRIYATGEDYVVWADDEQRIWYETSNRNNVTAEDFHKFWNRYQITRCRSMQNLDDSSKASYLGMQSSAIASALEGQFMAAAESLESAAAFITTANERISRRRYTIGALIAFFSFLIVSSVLAIIYENPGSILFIIQKSTLGGALGAILSALAGRKEGLGFDPNASRSEGVSNGAIRVFYGVISAFVAVTVVKSGVLTTPLITSENQELSLIVVAIAGGFAERWAADLIQRFTADADPNIEKVKTEN